jgi:hypothetical protein
MEGESSNVNVLFQPAIYQNMEMDENMEDGQSVSTGGA